jgi:predicted nucleotide-binding protein (sugar kinase/HSP70/actin superfamily)
LILEVSALLPHHSMMASEVEKIFKYQQKYGGKENLTPKQMMKEVRSFVKYSRRELLKVSHLKAAKDKCLTMFEQESQELQKGWLMLEDSKKEVKQQEQEMLSVLADKENNIIERRRDQEAEFEVKQNLVDLKKEELSELEDRAKDLQSEARKEND